MLVGRQAERVRIDRLLADAAGGRGGALVVRGEAGIGKTALLDYARERATGQRVATSGVESELELPFAGLADVLRPLLAHLGELTDTQAEVLHAALGLGPPRPVDRFAIGAASLALLAAGAGEEPLLVVVDDAHWLDSASREALLFAARRLQADPVAVLFAARDGEPVPFQAAEVESLGLGGLRRDEAVALLDGTVAPAAMERLFELTHGNPLALLELPAPPGDTGVQVREPFDRPFPVSAGIERAFARRALVLGEPVRRTLVVAAADDSGSVEIVATAARALGGGLAELQRAEDAGLVQIGGARLVFRHPLVRAAVYQEAAPSERREAHRELAAALKGRDELRCAWHTAAAATGPDPAAASALAAVGAESRSRGAYAAAVSAFELAARLTPDAGQRPLLLARAADAAWLAGRTPQARALVAEALRAHPERTVRAELLGLHGRMGVFGDDQETAYETLLEAAQLVDGDDPALAGELLADAIAAAIQLGGTRPAEAAARLTALQGDNDPLRTLLLAQALLGASSFQGDLRGRHRLASALDRAETLPDVSALHLLWAGRGRWMLGHNDQAARLARRALDRARSDAALALVPQALRLLAAADFDRGRWRSAYAAAGEAVEVGQELEQHTTVCACLALLAEIDAAAGNEDSCRTMAKAAVEIALEKGLGFYRERAERALGRLELAAGRIESAIERLAAVDARLEQAGNREPNTTAAWDLVEAHARAGNLEVARALLARAEVAMPAATAAEEAIIQRCLGIVSDETFEPAFERALAAHTAEPFPFEQARTELAYGARLRRAGRRTRARLRLRAAQLAFDDLAATAWAAQARNELVATGEKPQPTQVSRESLTPRETQVALAVAQGTSNKEVAAALYLTPKTVEYHLTRVYRKLGVRSRAELARTFAADNNRP